MILLFGGQNIGARKRMESNLLYSVNKSAEDTHRCNKWYSRIGVEFE